MNPELKHYCVVDIANARVVEVHDYSPKEAAQRVLNDYWTTSPPQIISVVEVSDMRHFPVAVVPSVMNEVAEAVAA